LNGLLLWLICCASTSNLRSYTRILKLHCIFDLVYILILEITSLVSFKSDLYMCVFLETGESRKDFGCDYNRSIGRHNICSFAFNSERFWLHD
jgi:hypothetical protein